jgi:hypothetical protein
METTTPPPAAVTRAPPISTTTTTTTNLSEQTPAPVAPTSQVPVASTESAPVATSQQSNEQLDQLRQMLANVRPAGKLILFPVRDDLFLTFSK